jgi:hypothetical protein
MQEKSGTKNFYNSLNLDDTNYFISLPLFKNENILHHPVTQKIELKFLVTQLLILPNMCWKLQIDHLF